jgi:ABC-type ATPase involved in cell division
VLSFIDKFYRSAQNLYKIRMIIFQNVSKIYNINKHQAVALEDASFTINPKEFVSVVGKSGAGKSTIVKLLIGEEKPTKGRIIFSSHDVNKLKNSRWTLTNSCRRRWKWSA